MNGYSKDTPIWDAEEREAAFERGRLAGDGIPRSANGMKWDWALDIEELEDALTNDKLEEHIARLMREQVND